MKTRLPCWQMPGSLLLKTYSCEHCISLSLCCKGCSDILDATTCCTILCFVRNRYDSFWSKQQCQADVSQTSVAKGPLTPSVLGPTALATGATAEGLNDGRVFVIRILRIAYASFTLCIAPPRGLKPRPEKGVCLALLVHAVIIVRRVPALY